MRSTVRSATSIGLLVLCLVLTGGCVSTEEQTVMQNSILTLDRQMREMNRRMDEMETRVATLETQVRGDTGVSLPDVQNRLEEMQIQLGSFDGKIQEVRHEMKQLRSDMRKAPGAATGGESSHVSVPASPTQTQPQTPAPEPVETDQSLYDKALNTYQAGKYDTALKEFGRFMDRYPDSELADNAQFWIGEARFHKKQYREAIEAYQKVMDLYPQGNKTPHAMLRQGAAWEELGDALAAKIIYEKLVEQHPDSPPAQIAVKKLERM